MIWYVAIRACCKLHSTKHKAVVLNDSTVYQQIYLTASKSSKKKKEKKRFPCHVDDGWIAGLPVRRCWCTMEATMWQLDISESTAARWCNIMCVFHLCHPRPEPLMALISFAGGPTQRCRLQLTNISCVIGETRIQFTQTSPQLKSVRACLCIYRKNTAQVSFTYLFLQSVLMGSG